MLARPHQRKLNLVLDVLDVEGAAVGLAADQRIHHGPGKLLNQLANAGRSSALAAVDGQEGLGHGNGDLARLEADDGTVAADDFVLGVTLRIPVGRAIFRGVTAYGSGRGQVGGKLHFFSLEYFCRLEATTGCTLV